MSELGLELGKWLFDKRPGLLVFRDEDTAEALNATASAIGGLLAVVLVRSGEDAYRQTLSILFSKADDAARRTARSTEIKIKTGRREPKRAS